MGFLAAGSIDLHAGIAIMLGANVGTCITAFIASIGGGTQAKLTAYAHIWLNVMGVAFLFPLSLCLVWSFKRLPVLRSAIGTRQCPVQPSMFTACASIRQFVCPVN